MMIMSLLHKMMLLSSGQAALKRFRDQCRNAKEIQESLALRLIRKNQESQYGKDHRFNLIHSMQDFKRILPIINYEVIKPYIDRAIQGVPAQLTIDKPIFFAMTSGTTGDPKYIPVTAESDRMKSKLMRIWTSKLCLDHPDIYGGKILTVVSPGIESYTPDGTPCGSESGHAFLRMPDIIKAFYSCPYEVFEIGDYEEKYYLLLRLAAVHPIQVIYTCNPSTVYLLGNRLGQFSEDIIRDIHDGTICRRYKIPYDLAIRLKSYIKKDPARTKFLEEAMRKGNGKLLPKFVWPKMAAIACWKGGSVSMYLSKFSRFYPEGISIRDIGYFSSEFRGSIPLSDDGSEGVLAIPANVYEFFPIIGDQKPEGHELLSINQLEKGKQYFVYVTTAAGLCRYDMNDVIEVTGYYENAPMIRFMQKGKGMVSFTGEKLAECQITQAVEQAFQTFNEPYEFIAAIGELIDDTPRYTFLIEFERPVETGRVEDIANQIERGLCLLNVEYAAKRKSKRILPPLIKIIQPGEYEQYRKRVIEARNSDGQFKILKLTSDESFAKNFRTRMEVSAAA